MLYYKNSTTVGPMKIEKKDPLIFFPFLKKIERRCVYTLRRSIFFDFSV